MTQEQAMKIYDKLVRKEFVTDSERAELTEYAIKRFQHGDNEVEG